MPQNRTMGDWQQRYPTVWLPPGYDGYRYARRLHHPTWPPLIRHRKRVERLLIGIVWANLFMFVQMLISQWLLFATPFLVLVAATVALDLRLQAIWKAEDKAYHYHTKGEFQ